MLFRTGASRLCLRSQQDCRTVLVAAIIFLLASASTGRVCASPIKYCNGKDPCFEVCECPPGVAACDANNPPPCCLGSDPCSVVAPDDTELFVGLLADLYGDIAVQETAVISGYRPGTVVIEFFSAGRLTSQKVVDLVEPSFHARIDLSLLGSGADSFRIYLDQPVRDGIRETSAPPAVFHVVEARRSISRAERRRVLETIGSLRTVKRLAPESTRPQRAMCD